jgi:hypothetical protein
VAATSAKQDDPRDHYQASKVFFLLAGPTASSTASGKQQSVQLVYGAASGNLDLLQWHPRDGYQPNIICYPGVAIFFRGRV